MESKLVEVWKNGRRVSELKKEKECLAQKIGANCKILTVQLNSPVDKLGKRKRKDGKKTKCGSHLNKTVFENYSNFMKSGVPQRVLFYQNDEWNDFPRGIVDMIKEDFSAKKAAIEVQINDCHTLLDILYMIQVDLITGLQTPIAWIDEAGSCYFPKLFYVNCEGDQLQYPTMERKEKSASDDTEINLHLEIEVNGLSGYNVEDCIEESNVGVKRVRTEQRYILASNNHCHKKTDDKLDHSFAGKQRFGENAHINFAIANETITSDTVKNLFLESMSTWSKLDILEIRKCSSSLLKSRKELFGKQVEIVQKYRGQPNVQYAWLPCTRDSIPSILMHGVGHWALERFNKGGCGVNLSAVSYAHSSAKYCDSDENGIRYMVFCRVILGSMERVHPGSLQSHPSCDEYDSGVDNLESPSQYIIWSMNVNTHIYPEFIVGFRMFPSIEGSGVTTELPHGNLWLDSNSVDMGKKSNLLQQISHPEAPAIELNAPKLPKSAWMPFPLLFQAISHKVSAESMKLLHNHYDLFRTKKVKRDDFIKMLRLAVGDQLLKSTIISLQSKTPSNPACSLKVPEEEHEC